MVFVSLQKVDRNREWGRLDLSLQYNIIKGFNDLLFVTPLTELDKQLFKHK